MLKLFVINEQVQFYENYCSNCNVGVVYRKTGKIGKILRRLHLKSSLPFFHLWFSKEFRTAGKDKTVEIILFDTILTLPAVKYIKKKYPNNRIIYWYWNHIYHPEWMKEIPEGVEKWSYDPEDCRKYGLNFNTQFYFKAIADYRLEDYPMAYDFSFVGATKSRADKIAECEKLIDNRGFSKQFIVIDYNSKVKRVHGIPYSEVIDIVRKSRCVVDILPDAQKGLSIRPLEALFMHKKLITNYKPMKELPFYSTRNIFIMGIDKDSDLDSFMKAPFDHALADEQRDYYDFKSWLNRFQKNNG
jgi:hypothetical protein